MSSYSKFPTIKINGFIVEGCHNISGLLSELLSKNVLIVDTYTGVDCNQIKSFLQKLGSHLLIDTADLFEEEKELKQKTQVFMSEDSLFGYVSNLTIEDYFNSEKLNLARIEIADSKSGVIIFGPGASLVSDSGVMIYADMPRWEIQQRMRKKEVIALGMDNRAEDFSYQYKRGYFNDWRVLDRHKQKIYQKVDFWLDTTQKEHPKLIDKKTFYTGLEKAAASPFRVMPFFDAAPWGGQWMKERFDLDKSIVNYGWCFDCVPEENSLLLEVNGAIFETPAVNLVYEKSLQLLGEAVESRFGKEFPIRFDFLDTMQGGNLSLQVHPTTHYAYNHFGIHYTQDESYYIMDAKEGAVVYLGLKNNIDQAQMINDLENARDGDLEFNADAYTNVLTAKKHDHFLIPAGTVHCSGADSLVLEISATPNLFTFKLWDWNRLGLDGKPRPNNVERGKEVINWKRDTHYVQKELVNQFEIVASGNGWMEERTGLHKTEFIETRRHTFSQPVLHQTHGSVNVLNLVEGEEVIVESPFGAFQPYIINYAETFIVPACVKEYSIRPHGTSEGKECKTIKAFVRF